MFPLIIILGVLGVAAMAAKSQPKPGGGKWIEVPNLTLVAGARYRTSYVPNAAAGYPSATILGTLQDMQSGGLISALIGWTESDRPPVDWPAVDGAGRCRAEFTASRDQTLSPVLGCRCWRYSA